MQGISLDSATPWHFSCQKILAITVAYEANSLNIRAGNFYDVAGNSIGQSGNVAARSGILLSQSFEPSVPRDTIEVSRAAHVASACFPANGKVGANENRKPRGRRLPSAGPMVRILFHPAASLQTFGPAPNAISAASGTVATVAADCGCGRNHVSQPFCPPS